MDRPSRPVNAPPAFVVPASTPRVIAPPRRTSAPRGATLALAAVLLLPACSFFQAPEIQRGNRVTDDQLAEITPGVQTRADVQALLGSPTQTSTFGDNSWYYISAKTRQRPGRQLALSDQETVVIAFDARGVVQEIKRLTDADGQSVTMVSRETPTPGNERTLLQALFGNVGRIGPGTTSGGGGPSGAPGSGPVTPGPATLR